MDCSLKKTYVANYPLYIVYYLLPLISAAFRVMGHDKINYEFLWMAVLPFFVFIFLKAKLPRWCLNTMFVVIGLTVIKYIAPIFWTSNIVLRALVMDYKWIYYLILSSLWCGYLGQINTRVLYKCGRNFAIFYNLFILLMTLKNGYDRGNGALLDECNYDCYLMLIPFCFIKKESETKWDYLVFILAALLSTSKTSVFVIFFLLFYPYYERSKHKLFYTVLFLALLAAWVSYFLLIAGNTEFEDIDRVTYFAQFFSYLSETSWIHWLFGYFPGVSMQLKVLTCFEWNLENFEEMNGFVGCFPFYFHSTYMRMAIVWGVIPTVIGVAYLIGLFSRCNYYPLKNLILLLLLESISLSTLSLVNVSFIYMITIISTLLEYKKYKTHKRITRDANKPINQ